MSRNRHEEWNTGSGIPMSLVDNGSNKAKRTVSLSRLMVELSREISGKAPLVGIQVGKSDFESQYI